RGSVTWRARSECTLLHTGASLPASVGEYSVHGVNCGLKSLHIIYSIHNSGTLSISSMPPPFTPLSSGGGCGAGLSFPSPGGEISGLSSGKCQSSIHFCRAPIRPGAKLFCEEPFHFGVPHWGTSPIPSSF